MALDGTRVGVTSHRKGDELAAALQRRGARVVHGPTVGGDEPVPGDEVRAATEAVVDAAPTWLVASTGVGMRLWADAAAEHDLLAPLRATAANARCVARGPKAVGGLHALGVKPVWTSTEQTDRDVADWLAPRVTPDDVVACQLHGTATTRPFDPVARAGARLLAVATYRHRLPDDHGPALELIDAILDGDLDVIVFTSPGAVRNLVTLTDTHRAGQLDALRRALRSQVATAVIGPVTAAALQEEGITPRLTPARSRTGELLRSLQAWAG